MGNGRQVCHGWVEVAEQGICKSTVICRPDCVRGILRRIPHVSPNRAREFRAQLPLPPLSKLEAWVASDFHDLVVAGEFIVQHHGGGVPDSREGREEHAGLLCGTADLESFFS